MMTDKMREAIKLLSAEAKRLRLQGSQLAADRLESAKDYINDAAAELDEENHAELSEFTPWGPAHR